jgi:hypothetical protein
VAALIIRVAAMRLPSGEYQMSQRLTANGRLQLHEWSGYPTINGSCPPLEHSSGMLRQTFADNRQVEVPNKWLAKETINLILGVASAIDGDADVRDRSRTAYPAHYNVILNQGIAPAAESAEQISLAGTEASGTGNMTLKFNGALTNGRFTDHRVRPSRVDSNAPRCEPACHSSCREHRGARLR